MTALAGPPALRRIAFLDGSFRSIEDFNRAEVADLLFLPILAVCRVPYFQGPFVGAEFEACFTIDSFDCCYFVSTADSGGPMVDRIVICQSVRRSNQENGHHRTA